MRANFSGFASIVPDRRAAAATAARAPVSHRPAALDRLKIDEPMRIAGGHGNVDKWKIYSNHSLQYDSIIVI